MGLLKFFFYMIPVFRNLLKDLIFGEIPLEEIKINYIFEKANAYDRANLSQKAIKEYEKILRREPRSIPVFMNLGGLYFRRGMHEKAIPYYEKVIRINPKHYQAHYWLAVCYWRLGRYYTAINTLEEIIEFLPTYKDALNLLGECYERIGEGQKAEHYYLKAFSVDPNGIVIHGGILSQKEKRGGREERIKH
ncbi:MAG: tetratricopeptide repeat protein [Thermodesulfobacteriota bacterium]